MTLWHPFFQLLSDNAGKELLGQFAHAELDSSGNSIELVRAEVGKALMQLPDDSPLLHFLDSLTGEDQVKIQVSSIAYHLYSNGEPVTIRSIRNRFVTIENHRAWLEYGLPDLKARLSLARMTNGRIGIGDTVRVNFPVDSSLGVRTAIYPSPTCSMIRDTVPTDSLVIVGVVRSKTYGELYPSGVDSTDLIFHLELLDVNDPRLLLNGNAIGQGDTLRFHVTLYGREIRKWCAPKPNEH